MHSEFTDSDRAALRAAAIPENQAAQQLAILRRGMMRLKLEKPCRIGSGIVQIDPDRADALIRCHDEAARAGRLMKFVPASGAATRMFRDLSAWLASEQEDIPEAVERFFATLEEQPFYRDLTARPKRSLGGAEGSTRADRYRATLRTLLLPDGLDFLRLPKALVPFHEYADGVRSAFADHLVEAIDLVRDELGQCRIHLTVSGAHRTRFEEASQDLARTLGEKLSADLRIELSCQAARTDTVALDAAGQPFRARDGELLLRPGGHGALLENLAAAGGDLVLIKNIDNIQRQPALGTNRWMKVLCGLAASLHSRAGEILRGLQSAPEKSLDAALAFTAEEFGLPADLPPDDVSIERKRAVLRQQLDRPLRVCGVVPNEGHAGGGPFWVRHRDGTTSRQIVESAEINLDDPAQVAILDDSTHFNPVIMACAVRDFNGDTYDLSGFRDPTACFVADKTFEGRPLTALEHPGLWNGAMTGWNTIFVELPTSTFTPVKTVADLLGSGHRTDLRLTA